MSLSGLFAAKKRIETSIKKYEIPTKEEPLVAESCENGVLLLSLLQSRLNWTNYVFPKYKSDATQQPKRTATSRKKWPCMQYLGTCTLELGAHLFEQTNFYQATRKESWDSIAKSEGLEIPNEQAPSEHLVFHDIVFELNEVSNERFIFPKEAIIEVTSNGQDDFTIHVSFVLPLDHSVAEAFFDTPKNKILKYGKSCPLDVIKNFVINDMETMSPSEEHQPVNIRITKVNAGLMEALKSSVNDPVQVANTMKEKIKQIPKKKYVQFKDVENKTEIEELIQKASTVPDISSGPIQAEKKRNEILNAIKLGKRLRDEKFEAELPKNKYVNVKEDLLLKCAYCSTRYTNMWRQGPSGQGTLCNSCGIQWKRGEILVDAPIISKEEELRLLLERREKEKAVEVIEVEREVKKQQQKRQQHSLESSVESVPLQRKSPVTLPAQHNIPDHHKIDDSSKKKKLDSTDPKPKPKQQQQQQQQHPVAPQKEQNKPVPLSLYSTAGIPLPTLSIDFPGTMQFCHPNCGITLLDRYFSVRLCKDGCEQTTINFDKADLMNAQFEVVSEGEQPLQREILRMKIAPEPKSIVAFDQTLTIDKTHCVHVRFLEKLDPSGGAVVQRILQRWLVTVPSST